LVILRHEEISKANGLYIANGGMRTLRAIYNHARKSCRTLPSENPVNALDWNRERRRDTALGLADLKAFDIPLSRAMCRCLIRALKLGRMLYPDQAQDWIFPADSGSGHLAEHKENRKTLTKWGNELRQTYRTVGQIASVGDLDMDLLMNHSVYPSDEGPG